MMLRCAAAVEKRRYLTVPALFLCLSSAGCSRAAPPSCDVDPATAAPGQVARVVDGDTLHLDSGDKVRVIGINTPELGRGDRPPQPLAEEARAALSALVGSRDQVLLVNGRDDRDRHGRRLAHLFDVRGRNLTAEMLRRGMGFHVAVSPNFAYLDCLQAAEEEARSAGVGVWGQPGLQAIAVSSLAPGRGGFARVKGRVSRVSFKPSGWWIQLDGKVGLQIKTADQHLFSRRELQSFEGRELEARGWLVPMKGDWWLMNIGHPTMLMPVAAAR